MQLKKTIKVTLCASLIATSYGCSSTKTKQNSNPQEIANNTSSNECLNMSYMKEGFINDQTFRVVIFEDIENTHSNFNEIKIKGEKRALIILRKFLISKNRIVDTNTTAHINSLIENYGELKLIKKNCNKSSLYTFDIKKNGIKSFIASFAKKR